jgi:hypothetical protein
MFKIDKDIPLPAPYHPTSSHDYPVKIMEIGDSFFVPLAGKTKEKAREYINGVCWNHGRKNGKRYSIRLNDDKDGYRIWRVK